VKVEPAPPGPTSLFVEILTAALALKPARQKITTVAWIFIGVVMGDCGFISPHRQSLL